MVSGGLHEGARRGLVLDEPLDRLRDDPRLDVDDILPVLELRHLDCAGRPRRQPKGGSGLWVMAPLREEQCASMKRSWITSS